MAFCSKCGRELGENDSVCPNCGEQVGDVQPKENIVPGERGSRPDSIAPLTIVGLVFSIMACFLGFVLITCVLATARGFMSTMGIIVLQPAFVGLAINIYQMFGEKSDKRTKFFALIGTGLSAFVILYAFIGWLIVML